MKVGDFVVMKNDTEPGLVVEINKDAEPSWGRCWYVFFVTHGGSLPMWQFELEVVSEGR